MDGILFVDKPVGLTSHDVVYKIKRQFKSPKVGHTGTLDPFASGLLIVCLGKATKLAHIFQNADKAYDATITFGKFYDTYDVTGTLVQEKEVSLTKEAVLKVLGNYKKTYLQEPPMYSAIKVDGKKLYDLAREGITIKRELREVTIFELKLNEMISNDEISISTDVSKGTYIRSLAVDIAQSLGTIGALKTLRRTRVGKYSVCDAKPLSELSENDLYKLEDLLKSFPKLVVNDYLVHLAKNGTYFDERQIETEEPFVVYNESDELIAYYEPIDKFKYKPVLIL
jgi:tRNA pseudouridine55 synthase